MIPCWFELFGLLLDKSLRRKKERKFDSTRPIGFAAGKKKTCSSSLCTWRFRLHHSCTVGSTNHHQGWSPKVGPDKMCDKSTRLKQAMSWLFIYDAWTKFLPVINLISLSLRILTLVTHEGEVIPVRSLGEADLTGAFLALDHSGIIKALETLGTIFAYNVAR